MATIFVAARESNSSLLAASWPGWQARLDKAHPGRQALTQTLEQHEECRCRSDYFIRASRNFFALQSFFSRISQEVV